MTTFVNITPDAEEYLANLLAKQKVEGMAVRVFITQPGTKYAETCLASCRPEEANVNDEVQQMDKLKVYVEAMSVPYLVNQSLSYKSLNPAPTRQIMAVWRRRFPRRQAIYALIQGLKQLELYSQPSL